MAESRLGRGLAALIGDVGDESAVGDRATRGQRKVPIEFVRANPRNPRRMFTETELDELAKSIRERGVIQPVVVRRVPGAQDAYEIIAGERRWRASQRAGQHEIPIVLIEANDREALELAIIENVQRSDLNPLEEAMGYESLAQEYAHSQDDIARVVGKSRSHVANMLRLLNLPDSVKAYVSEGKISAGHARALLALPDPEAVAREVVEKGLNVRAVEMIAQESAAAKGKPAQKRTRERAEKDADTRAVEKRLSDFLGMAVLIDHRGESGELKIRYRSLEQLDSIVMKLGGGSSG
jgi:ParB family chromosome partitioning protein